MLALASAVAAFALTSPAFHAGGRIPVRYTCDGANVAPVLRHTTPPRGTRALALEMIDPDAPVPGGFVHWLWAGSPETAGANSAGGTGYTGPCPPPGPPLHLQAVCALAPAEAAARLRRGHAA